MCTTRAGSSLRLTNSNADSAPSQNSGRSTAIAKTKANVFSGIITLM